ncbi:hypothetical protein [Acinetobacter johnsonii]|uniref:hypothetical protein n=1 Tax=Acinetobacter johnsonii TaxID=40214 RepID=UPI001F2FF922|nr:hypothetical protein [Acinetobacter johnsonii]
MTAEINRIRAENYYELYQPYYEQALKKQNQLAREKKQEEERKLQQNQDPSNGYDHWPWFWGDCIQKRLLLRKSRCCYIFSFVAAEKCLLLHVRWSCF